MGIIDLPSFDRDQDDGSATRDAKSSTKDMERILKDFEKDAVDVVILDLRRNGGGYLPEAVGVSGLFIDRGPVVQVKGGRRLRVLDDNEGGRAWSGPLVVLVSQLSASASEIVAGAIKDYDRGLVVGDRKTHGKGTVQSPIDVAEQLDHPMGSGKLGVFKLTIQQFYRPGGHSTQLEGVRSDVEIPSWTNVMDLGEESVPHALPAASIRPTNHKSEGILDPEMVKKLRESSAHRRSMSGYWLDLERQLSAYTQFRLKRSVPLEETAYMALQETMRSEKAAVGASETEEPKEKDQYKEPWFNEVLEITSQYALAVKRNGA
jgi:carboxyl-terminal processing protease